ncbi:TRAPP II complex [Cokeromyces recurvatus]|uniref:TRAPP II complex n=1 Tax=Cokeromyces recurvatus TaxID=90255 RepID=UPI00221FDC10|nr:TRAPP II complex [Cokeromyces recurvatus]KAI7903009.1 TRAPP II complex [Cokeromyces recurvatus]
MDLSIDVLSSCKIRVLLIPVSPIKRSTFHKYVDLFKHFHLIRLGDVTPDLKKGANAMFSSQVFQEGQMHFEFLTHWTRDHAELEDFQPHRRIFGVIGIMDCQEWKDLNEGYKQFEQNLDKYPTAIANRCFAFDPSETQEDNTKGLIMIPNVGNMSFYMSTMICDFASEILEQFTVIAKDIENLQVLESPLPSRISKQYKQEGNQSKTSKIFSLQPQRLHRHQSSSSSATSTTGESMRTIKRTPGRIRKLLGDFYLLAGRLPDAINHYDHAIETTKVTSDYLWLASAMEGLICATLLLEFLQIDIGHIVSRKLIVSEGNTTVSSSTTGNIAFIMDQYLTILRNYASVGITASFPVPDIVYIEACLKISRLLTTVYLNHGWDQSTFNLLIQGKLTKDKNITLSFLENTRYSKLCGITRYQISEFVTKVWNVHIHELPLFNQIHIITSMATIYTIIGYHRKAGYSIHKGIELMLPLLVQQRRTSKQYNDDQGILKLLPRLCDIYGIGGQQQGGRSVGWPEIQMSILQQSISVSEAYLDHHSRLYYTTVLLKQLYRFIPKAEQIRLATIVQQVTLMTNQKDTDIMKINYWDVNLVSRIEVKKPISRKAVYKYNDTILDIKKTTQDPFIYNPFTTKKPNTNNKTLLVKDEVSEFDVTLINPFGFDLELQSIILSTQGIKFDAIPNMITIPANTTIPITLMGTPLETGNLIICGCFIQIIGFTEQEFLVTKNTTTNNDNQFIKLKKRKKIEDKEEEEKSKKFYELTVIDEQPLLKIKSTSLLHGAVMLYEGEMTHIMIEFENIGNIPIDYMNLSFTDSTMTLRTNCQSEGLSPEDQYELDLYTTGTHVFSWNQDEKEAFLLLPGEKKTIQVHVYGKRGCQGGTIQVDYGYMKRYQGLENTNSSLSVYTRQLYLNVLITVYQSLEPLKWDIVYLRQDLPASEEVYAVQQRQITKAEDLLLVTCNNTEDQDRNNYCLITLDVFNRWTIPFEIQFSINNNDSSKEDNPFLYTTIIQPESTTRIILPLKRFYLPFEICRQEIPSFEPYKQFVVTQGHSLNEERLERFWYREELLKRIKATWQSRSRTGELNLRTSLRLNEIQLGVLKKEDVEFIVDLKSKNDNPIIVKKLNHRRFECLCNESIRLTITIRNRLC